MNNLLELSLLKKLTALFVEDDQRITQNMNEALAMIFKQVYTASNGLEAIRLYQRHKPDFVFTDICMPVKDGLSLIESIRSQDFITPIIIISAFSDETYLMKASNLQIDGYIVKPVNLDKLMEALVRALNRLRNVGHLTESIPLFADFEYDLIKMQLTQNGKLIPLGKKENSLIFLLCKKLGQTVTKEEIRKVVWANETMTDSALKNLILSCRNKIDKNAIQSVPGQGWLINPKR